MFQRQKIISNKTNFTKIKGIKLFMKLLKSKWKIKNFCSTSLSKKMRKIVFICSCMLRISTYQLFFFNPQIIIKIDLRGWSSHFKGFSRANCRKSTNPSTTYYLSLIYLKKNFASKKKSKVRSETCVQKWQNNFFEMYLLPGF